MNTRWVFLLGVCTFVLHLTGCGGGSDLDDPPASPKVSEQEQNSSSGSKKPPFKVPQKKPSPKPKPLKPPPEEPSSKIDLSDLGLPNMGNTCFLNALTHALASDSTLIQSLFKNPPAHKGGDDHKRSEQLFQDWKNLLETVRRVHSEVEQKAWSSPPPVFSKDSLKPTDKLPTQEQLKLLMIQMNDFLTKQPLEGFDEKDPKKTKQGSLLMSSQADPGEFLRYWMPKIGHFPAQSQEILTPLPGFYEFTLAETMGDLKQRSARLAPPAPLHLPFPSSSSPLDLGVLVHQLFLGDVSIQEPPKADSRHPKKLNRKIWAFPEKEPLPSFLWMQLQRNLGGLKKQSPVFPTLELRFPYLAFPRGEAFKEPNESQFEQADKSIQWTQEQQAWLNSLVDKIPALKEQNEAPLAEEVLKEFSHASYELLAVLLHLGASGQGGHYVVWVRHLPPSSSPDAKPFWTHHNDSQAFAVPEEQWVPLEGLDSLPTDSSLKKHWQSLMTGGAFYLYRLKKGS